MYLKKGYTSKLRTLYRNLQHWLMKHVLVFFWFLIFILLSTSVIRSIFVARSNFITFEKENQNYLELQQENKSLQMDLKYYRSDEAKLTLLKKVYGYNYKNGQLLSIKTRPEFLDENVEYFNEIPYNMYKNLRKKLY